MAQLGPDEWECRSHNFPECVGVGTTESEAWEKMRGQLIWLADNKPAYVQQNVQYRLNNKIICMCGAPLEEPPLAVVGGGNKILGIT